MKFIVDELPENAEDCPFSDVVNVVRGEYILSDDVEVCEDCGGVIVDNEDIEEMTMCALSGLPCDLEMQGFCNWLKPQYQTKGVKHLKW